MPFSPAITLSPARFSATVWATAVVSDLLGQLWVHILTTT
jgi:hypothetical protein